MTIYTKYETIGAQQDLSVFYDDPTLMLYAETPTTFALADDAGARIEFTGTDFVYVGNLLADGLISSIVLRDMNGTKLVTFTDMAQSLADIWTAWDTEVGVDPVSGEPTKWAYDCLKVVLMQRNDTIIGCSLGETMHGHDGRDVLRGKGGDDYLVGGAGNDRLFGGRGADSFVFSDKFGTDVILDFRDTGRLADQDIIRVSATSYAAMVAVQTGTDVDISFGGSNHIILKNYTLASLGLDDFILS